MRLLRWTLALALLTALALASGPSFVTGPADAAPKKGGDTFIYDGGFLLEGSSETPLFTDQALCHITCADGDHHHTDADDIDDCVADCNEVCNTDSCRPA